LRRCQWCGHTRRAAADWRTDPQAAVNIEAHLERSGFDQIDIDAQVIAQARELFRNVRPLKAAGSHCLREISVRREFARRAQVREC
jgi:hypothetical protein